MNISEAQIKNLKAAVAAGLKSFYRPPMLTCSEYADHAFLYVVGVVLHRR